MSQNNKEEQKNQKQERDKRGENGVFLGIIQLVLVVIFIAGSFLISGILKSGKQEVQKREVQERVLFAETETISPAPYRIAFETTGAVIARADISVSPQISGNVIAVNDSFFTGGAFEANEVLFEIEPLDFELEIRRLQSTVAQARTAFNLEEAESAAAIAEWEQINADKPVPALVARKPQKAEAWANLKAAKAQLESSKLNLERTQFSLPFAGRVSSADLEVGQFVSAGQSYGSVYDVKNLEVQTSLKDMQLSWLMKSDAQDIQITTTHFGETRTYEGFLKRGVSSLNSQTRFASVNFGFKEPPDSLLPGTFVTLDIKGPTIKNALALPVNALQKDNKIWGVDESDALYPIDLNIVFNDEDHVVLKDANGAVEVVTTKLPGAIEGMVIRTLDTPMREGGDSDE